MRFRLFSSAAILLLAASLAWAQQDLKGEKSDAEMLDADIRELIEVSNMTKIADQIVDQIFTLYEKTIPSVPKEIWKQFRVEMKADDFVEIVVPIYAKHYTREDIKGLIAFYRTPLGKKVIEKQGLIAKESMAAGMSYGQGVAKKIISRLLEKGYKLPPNLKI